MENEEIKNEERFVKKQINPDQDFYGFTMRTRRHFRDESILRDELERDIYQIPENPKVVIDIGAHIGGTALRCAKAGATVYAFEPEYSNFKTLVYNVIKNNLRDKVFPINMGIGERGHSKLYTHLNNSGAVSTQTVQSGLDSDRYQVIALMPLEDVFEQYKIEKCNLLKMDCEGGEEYVIRNLADEMAGKIEQISLEFHDKQKIKELLEILSKWYTCVNTSRYEWVCKKKKESQ